MAKQIKVYRLERPMPTADIGRPLRWAAEGPNGEIQKFRIRDDAKLYARIRAKSVSSNEAMKLYSRC